MVAHLLGIPAGAHAEEESALRELGADQAEIQTRREETFGEAAAERLAELDRRRAQWDERVALYRAERDALEAGADRDEAGSEADWEAELSRLRSRHFEGPELVRIRALDAIAASESHTD